jgi:nitrate reductase gamma subunit
MNRAFLVIWIPAFATTFYWLYEGYNLRAAILGTVAMVAVAVGVIFLLRRREKQAARRT